MIVRTIILLLAGLTGFQPAPAQDRALKEDSLKNLLKGNLSDSVRIRILNNLSFTFRTKDFIQSRNYGKEALALSKKTGNLQAEGNTHTRLGLAYFYHGDFDSSDYHYQEALKIALQIKDTSLQGNALNHMGNLKKNRGEMRQAKKLLEESNKLFTLIKDTAGMAMTLMNLGSTVNKMGMFEASIDYYLRASELQKQRKDWSSYARTLNGIGNTYHEMKNFKTALEFYEKAVEYFIKTEEPMGECVALSNMGNACTYLNEDVRAEQLYLQSLEIAKKIKSNNRIGAAYLNLGSIYRKLKRFAESETYFVNAEKILIDKGTKNELAILYMNMGSLYGDIGNRQKAIKYLHLGSRLTKEVGDPSIIIDLYKAGAEIHKTIKNYDSSVFYLEKLIHLRDSLYTRETTETVSRMQADFDLESKNRELSFLEKEKELRDSTIKKQKSFIFILVACSLVFVSLIGVSFFLYRKAKKTNQRLEQANSMIEERGRAIADSIVYAKRIQEALLPSPNELGKVFPSGFGIYRPKDNISGDFYWFMEKGEWSFLAVADCTGHGVPGAMMSVLGSDKLTHAVKEAHITEPGKILDYTNAGVKNSLKQTDESGSLRDGMDIALVAYSKTKNQLFFAGANRPLFLIRKRELQTFQPDKSPVGGHTPHDFKFSTLEIPVEPGDKIYLYTDGIPDQFGGRDGKKFMSKRLKEGLVQTAHLPMWEQEKAFLKIFDAWKGDLEQVDDILMIGISL
jgi:tetratricopeptide (TPR) repeat protein